MPALAALMRQGRYGLLETFEPTESPAIWTSIATGKAPEKHGILGFTREGSDGSERLYTSRDRRTKALWNILGDYGLRVCVVGWWMTYPVEPVDGVMVAQTNTDAQARAGNWKGSLLEGVPDQVYPPHEQDRIMGLFREVEANLPGRVDRLFGEIEYPEDSQLERSFLDNSMWAFRADAAYERIVRNLTRTDGPFDLTMVYFGGPDVVGHRYWRYRAPELYQNPPSAEKVDDFGSFIDDYYEYVDGAIGKLCDSLDPNATVIVVSDHGMEAANLEGRFRPDAPPMRSNSALHEDAPPGMLVAAGGLVEPGGLSRPAPRDLSPDDLLPIGSVLDVAPTILTLLGIPVGEDMDGEVLAGTFETGAGADDPAPIPTHDTPEFLEERADAASTDAAWQQERLEQLRSLGYID